MIIKYHTDKVYRPMDNKNVIRRGLRQDAKQYYLPRKMRYPALEFLNKIPLIGWCLRLALWQAKVTYKCLTYVSRKLITYDTKLISKEI